MLLVVVLVLMTVDEVIFRTEAGISGTVGIVDERVREGTAGAMTGVQLTRCRRVKGKKICQHDSVHFEASIATRGWRRISYLLRRTEDNLLRREYLFPSGHNRGARARRRT